MQGETIGQMVDGLGVTLNIGRSQRLVSVLVIGKVINMNDGDASLVIGSSKLDWIEEGGLMEAAQLIRKQVVQDQMTTVDCDDDEDEGEHGDA